MIIDPYVWLTTPILKVEKVASRTVIVRVARPDNYDFTPGQYAIIQAKVDGARLLRQYSFTSQPSDQYLEFLIRELPLGSVSSWFYEAAKRGDLIRITKPYGHFAAEQDKKAVYIAGGVGIAPFLSMLHYNDLQATLIYSERTRHDVVFDKELTRKLGSRYHLVLSRDTGRITAEDLRPYLDMDTIYYLCGSKQFVDSVEAMLLGQNIDRMQIRREAFTLQ